MSEPMTLQELRDWHMGEALRAHRRAKGYEDRGMHKAAKPVSREGLKHLRAVECIDTMLHVCPVCFALSKVAPNQLFADDCEDEGCPHYGKPHGHGKVDVSTVPA